jgi:hypothetical protein
MKLKFRIIFNEQNHLVILGIIWVVIQSTLFAHYGIVTGFEAEKYINEAKFFLQFGKLTSDNFWLYSTEIFLIVAVIKLHLGFFTVVLIQLLLNLFSTWMFYKLAIYFLDNLCLSFLVTFIFIINITYQVYNSYLFTESIFYSLTIIYSSYLLRIKTLNVKNITALFCLLSLMSITRPTGILFFAATIIYIFFRFLNNISLLNKAIITFCAFIIFFVTLNSMLETGGSLDFMLPFKKENIICGVNTTTNADIQVMEKGNSLEGLFYYIVYNKSQFFKLSKLKTISFFGFIRDYYSSFHNIYLIIFFYPFYILSIVGIIKKIRQKDKIIIYLLAIICLYWITTLLTCDDWHNRFILTVSPFIFLMGIAAFTVSNTNSEKNNYRNFKK